MIERILQVLARASAASPAPAPVVATADTGERLDGNWTSILNGMGNINRDRSVGVRAATARELTQRELEALYTSNGIAAKIIDLPIDDAARPGYEVRVGNDADAALEEAITAAAALVPIEDGGLISRRGLLAAVVTAQKVADLYGGAVIVGLLRDGQDPLQPLMPGRLEALEGLLIFDRHRATPERDAARRVVAWQLSTPSGAHLRVHPSRCVVLGGTPLTPSLYEASDGWPASRLQRVLTELVQEGTTSQTIAHLVQEAVVGKYSIPGLAQLVAANNTTAIKAWMATTHAMRSVFNAVLIDSGGGGYSSDTINFTGLTEVLSAWPERVAAVAEIPQMLLYGKSAPGLNANGDADLRAYYDRVDSRYRGASGRLTAALQELLRWLCLSRSGPTGGRDVPRSLVWGSLWTPSAKEEAETRLLTARTDALYLDRGVLSPAEVAASRYGGRVWSAETALAKADRPEDAVRSKAAATDL